MCSLFIFHFDFSICIPLLEKSNSFGNHNSFWFMKKTHEKDDQIHFCFRIFKKMKNEKMSTASSSVIYKSDVITGGGVSYKGFLWALHKLFNFLYI